MAQARTSSTLIEVSFEGSDLALLVPLADEAGLRHAFEAAYRQRFAFVLPDTKPVCDARCAQGWSGTGCELAHPPELCELGGWPRSPLTPPRAVRPGR